MTGYNSWLQGKEAMTNLFFGLLLISFVFGCADRIPEPERISVEGMANAVQVGDILIGSQPSRATLDQLAERGYRTVLSSRGQSEVNWDEKTEVESLGMNFVSIAMEKPVEEITDGQVKRFAEIMKHAERPLLLHCGSGNRISGLWALWLIENQNMAPQKALGLAKQTGMKGIRTVVEKRLKKVN